MHFLLGLSDKPARGSCGSHAFFPDNALNQRFRGVDANFSEPMRF